MGTTPDGTADQQDIASLVTTERLALCDLLDTLSPSDWSAPSLCPAWTVRDVVAHLTLATRDTVWDLVKGAIRARGNFDRMNADMARAKAAQFEPHELVQQVRDHAASTRHAPLSTPLDALTDVIVHAQDIARPLDRSHPMSPDHAVPALTHAAKSRWYGGMKRFDGVTLVATDTTWSMGTGDDEVRGTAGALLLMAAGRSTAYAELSGPGADSLARRL